MTLWFSRNFCEAHYNLLLLFVLHAISCQARIWPFVPLLPDARISDLLMLDSFFLKSEGQAPPASSVDMLRSTSIVEARSSCPSFNASTSQIVLNAPLENESVDCGGYREYAYNLTGSCSNKVYIMVVLTLQDARAPYASISVSLSSPDTLKATAYASASPNRRYYIVHVLSTCPGTHVIRVAHAVSSPRASFAYSIAPYTGSVLTDDIAVAGELSQKPGLRVKTFLYDNSDTSKPIVVTNSGSENTELFLFYPLLAQGSRDQGSGSLSVRASEAEIGVWILQIVLPRDVPRSTFSIKLSRSSDSSLTFYSIWINIIIILPSCCIIFFVVRCVRRFRLRGGPADGGFWNRDVFEMSNFQRSSNPHLPLEPLVLSVFLLEDEEGEPGVCEIAVAVPPVESLLPSVPDFYNNFQAAAMLRQA